MYTTVEIYMCFSEQMAVFGETCSETEITHLESDDVYLRCSW